MFRRQNKMPNQFYLITYQYLTDSGIFTWELNMSATLEKLEDLIYNGFKKTRGIQINGLYSAGG